MILVGNLGVYVVELEVTFSDLEHNIKAKFKSAAVISRVRIHSVTTSIGKSFHV